MRDPITARFIRTHEAAALLGLSARTLEKYRCAGTGPVFRKLGGRVVYAIEDLQAWADSASCRSTSDPHYVTGRAVGRDAARSARTTQTHRRAATP